MVGEGTSIRRSKVTLLFSLTCSVDIFILSSACFSSTNSSFFHISQCLCDIFRTVATPFKQSQLGKVWEFQVQLWRFRLHIKNAVTQNKRRIRNQVASEWMRKISVRGWVELHFTTISYILSFNYSYRYEINLIQMMYTAILRDPGAVSRVGRKGSTKVFKYRRNSPWVPTLTELFPKIQADASSWSVSYTHLTLPTKRIV